MRLSLFVSLAIAAVLSAQPSIGAGMEKHSLMHKREMIARELAWNSLPEDVQEDLAKRDPREYDLNWEIDRKSVV